MVRAMVASVLALLQLQLDEARRFWRNKQIRTALIVPWAEAYTVAFLAPVYPYFMQNLQLRPSSMGQLRTVSLVLNAASAPLAGWLLDKYGPFLGIALPSSLCAIGCALRSFAWGFRSLFVASVFSGLSGAKQDMSIAHLSRHTAPAQRTLAVAAARVQLQVLGLLGTACFTPLNALLVLSLPEATFGMLRFRIFISFCTIGCGFGVIVLLFASNTLSFDSTADDTIAGKASPTPRVAEEEEESDSAERGPICDRRGATGGYGTVAGSTASTPPSSPPTSAVHEVVPVEGRPARLLGSERACCTCVDLRLGSSRERGSGVPLVLLLSLISMFFSTTYRDLAFVVWPLFIKEHFGWAEREYALLLPMQQALAFSLIAVPWVHTRMGSARVVLALSVTSALGYAFSFYMQSPTRVVIGAHVGLQLLGGVANAALDLVLTAIASTFVPPSSQGRLFAALAIVRYAGAITGNLGATWLFQYSIDQGDAMPSVLFAGGALPLTLLAPLVLLNAVALSCCAFTPRRASKASPPDDELI